MYKVPRLRQMRRVGKDLSLTSGTRPVDTKCKLNTPPGMHGAKRTRISDYGINLKEKQAFRFRFGIKDHQLYALHQSAMKKMRTARKAGGEENYQLLEMLESRIDSTLYWMGFASTIREARQLLNHKTIILNGRLHNKPSVLVNAGDVIAIREKSKKQTRIQDAIKRSEEAGREDQAKWLSVDKAQLRGTVNRRPVREELSSLFDESRVIQFYSK